MLKLGLISFSNHLKNKVIPSIINNNKITIDGLLTKKKFKKKINFRNKKINVFNSEKYFFSKKKFDYIYISSATQKHYSDILKSLSISNNIICEKPLCLSTAELKKIYSLSIKKNCKIYEMIQYIHHPVFFKLQNLLKKKTIGKIKYIESNFCAPIIFNKKNFRFSNKKGNGALYDMGFYPVSILFTLFDLNKIKLLKKKITYKNKIDMSGNLIIQDYQNKIFNLNWGFESDYKNNLSIVGSKGVIDLDFIFSKNINQSCQIIIKKEKKIIKIKTNKANQIELAFEKIINSKKNYYNYSKKLTYKIIKLIEKIKKS